MTKTVELTLTLEDVVKAGGVEKAIIEACKEHDTIASGVVGSEFSTSGPGAGWSKTHDANDFASRAFAEGALHYIDAEDGRMQSASAPVGEIEEDEDGERTDENGNAVLRDVGGTDYIESVGWTDESVVCLECPSIEDAMENIDMVAEMAQAVIDYHGPKSDRKEWASLVRSIKDAAEALEDIDADKLI